MGNTSIGTFDLVLDILLKKKISLSGEKKYKNYVKKRPVRSGSAVREKVIIQDLMEKNLLKESGMTFIQLFEVSILDECGIDLKKIFDKFIDSYFDYCGINEKNLSSHIRELINKEENKVNEKSSN